MDTKVIHADYTDILTHLNSNRLKEAIYKLEIFLYGLEDWQLHNTLEEVKVSYEYMLKYMLDGIEDPERGKLYNKLIAKAFNVADRAHVQKMSTISGDYYSDRLRYFRLIPLPSLAELQMQLETYTEDINIGSLLEDNIKEEIKLTRARKNHEKAYIDLFYKVWLSDCWSAEEAENALTFLHSSLLQINDLSVLVSAVTMAVQELFDLRKVLFLFEAYKHTSNEVNQRALVGLVFALYRYGERIKFYPEITARLALLNEDEGFLSSLLRIQIQLLRSRETKKIDKKMREEIIPEMVRKANIQQRKFEMDELDDEHANDRNPDWQDWIEQSGLSDKLKEMSELQMEGADVYMSTFAQLKSYSFFHEMPNWFYPFDTQHPSVVQAFTAFGKKRNFLLDTIMQSGFFCNSDKYSFCLTMSHIPQAQREMMAQQFEAQSDALDEMKRQEKMIAYSQQAETISNQYIQDLYRFHKLYPRRNDFYDPFEETLNLAHCPVFRNLFNDSKRLLTLAEYFFHKAYYDEALELYQKIVETKGADAELLQKIGYCHSQERAYEKAIAAYLQADLLKPDSLWTNKQLALCYRHLKQYESAFAYYRKVENVQPESLPTLLQLGYCLVEQKQYNEALGYFFKVEYLKSDSIKAWRAIAWCSFVVGKYEQAMKYYEKVLEHNTPELQDHLNAGHVSWVQGDIKKAVERYRQTLLLAKDQEVFLSLFDKDTEELIRQGINREDIPLMLDLVAMAE